MPAADLGGATTAMKGMRYRPAARRPNRDRAITGLRSNSRIAAGDAPDHQKRFLPIDVDL
jgi:hypothetical protein